MHAVLVIEHDLFIREIMREHLEREGYVTCAVSTVRGGVSALRWTRFGLMLVDAVAVSGCEPELLRQLRDVGVPIVGLATATAGTVLVDAMVADTVEWSPFDPATLTAIVARHLPRPTAASSPSAGPAPVRSGTYLAGPRVVIATPEAAPAAGPNRRR